MVETSESQAIISIVKNIAVGLLHVGTRCRFIHRGDCTVPQIAQCTRSEVSSQKRPSCFYHQTGRSTSCNS